jgi:hypothetical protein
LLLLVDGHVGYILGLIHMVFSLLCWMAMSYVYIGQVEAILPMHVGHSRTPF